jgi:hypothetical protein
MLARAKAKGIPNFHIFGEVAVDPDRALAVHPVDGYPAVLDFAFQRAVADVVNGGPGPTKLAHLFAATRCTKAESGRAATADLPGQSRHGPDRPLHAPSPSRRLGRRAAGARHPGPRDAADLRGVPTIYYGDEQGFVGDGDDQDAREDMFASKVAVYNDNRLLGGPRPRATSFDTDGALYRRSPAGPKLRTASRRCAAAPGRAGRRRQARPVRGLPDRSGGRRGADRVQHQPAPSRPRSRSTRPRGPGGRPLHGLPRRRHRAGQLSGRASARSTT